MARYIDADKVMEEINRIGGHNLCEWDTIGVKDLICRQDTADVVPREEFEALQRRYGLAVAEREANVKGFAEEISKTSADVAREIFEEMKKQQYTILGLLDVVDIDEVAGIIKKYTEENT